MLREDHRAENFAVKIGNTLETTALSINSKCLICYDLFVMCLTKLTSDQLSKLRCCLSIFNIKDINQLEHQGTHWW